MDLNEMILKELENGPVKEEHLISKLIDKNYNYNNLKRSDYIKIGAEIILENKIIFAIDNLVKTGRIKRKKLNIDGIEDLYLLLP
ncbi:hypothetical protein [Picrophilus oshimae]|uniref:Uncharacterized protein n=1 Tax=Picrophilus torridus (strain ATCC 700027 / DSM 9790 / JCM 10055 / NBRC 100828 / KAW 2/3) TaxID=1122961 RepID=Q6L1U6_PICTO|nr:hypothetical protein [Picrophilus oshimae]AAT43056.1 hypothetical protein PTO0471 [Picrophilus oshimae DSM 9789]